VIEYQREAGLDPQNTALEDVFGDNRRKVPSKKTPFGKHVLGAFSQERRFTTLQHCREYRWKPPPPLRLRNTDYRNARLSGI
jgi:hypothetical protein